MTNEEKMKRVHTMILAIRVINRKIVNMKYQIAQFADSANFLLTNDVDAIIANRNQLDGDYFAATTIVEEEK